MPSITLTRLTGFDRNKKSAFDKDQVVLGTDAGADVRFDPTWDKTVTTRHVTLDFKQGAWWAQDSSKDGTFVGSRKIIQEKLSPGAVLELGRGGPKVQVDFAATANPATVQVSQSAASRPSFPGEPPMMPAASSAPVSARPVASADSSPKWLVPVAVMAVLAIAAVAAALYLRRPSSIDTGANADKALAQVARDFGEAVGLVVVTGADGPDGLGTAWAIAPNVYATNSHVSEPIRDLLAKGGSAYIAVNRRPDLRLKIVKAVVHPRYDKEEANFEGKKQAVGSYDVGLLYVEGAAPKFFTPASRAELEQLDSGYRIGFLGFPMEGLSGGGVDVRNPLATMQSGIITSVTDWWLAPAPFEKRFSVRHNLGLSGGASGSPAFNSAGHVVAILNAGTMVGTINRTTGDVVRAPSAVMINLAQRVDLLRDIWPEYPKN